jgi:hypothetical protein
MDSFPLELLTLTLLYVDHLYGPCFVSKQWYQACSDAKKHPIIAARHGDAFSLQNLPDNSDKYIGSIANKLCKRGYLSLSYKISEGRSYCCLSMLKSGKGEIILPLISSAHSNLVPYFAGRLGPNSVAYRMLSNQTRSSDPVLRGLCTGGHIEEFNRVRPSTPVNIRMIVIDSFGSNNIEFVKHMMVTYPVVLSGENYLQIMSLASSRTSKEVFRFALSIQIGDMKKMMTEKMMQCVKSPEIFEEAEEIFGPIFDSDWLYNSIYRATDKFLCWAYEKISKRSNINHIGMMSRGCLFGKFQFCKRISAKCTNCSGRYHN